MTEQEVLELENQGEHVEIMSQDWQNMNSLKWPQRGVIYSKQHTWESQGQMLGGSVLIA